MCLHIHTHIIFRELFALLEVVGLPKLHKMYVCDDGFKHSYVFKTKDPAEKCTYCNLFLGHNKIHFFMELVELLLADPDLEADPKKKFVINNAQLKIIKDTISYIHIFHSHEIKRDELPHHHDFIKQRLQSLIDAYGQGFTFLCSFHYECS